MSVEPDTTRPPDHYAWMTDLTDEHGRTQRVALVATPPGDMPKPLSTPDLTTALSMKHVAELVADALNAPVTLYAFRGEEVLQSVSPRRVQPATEMPPNINILDMKHN